MSLLPAASEGARQTDWLIAGLLLVSLLVLALVLGLLLFNAVRYRNSSTLDRGKGAQKTWRIETAWTAATLVAFFGLFVWSARLFVHLYGPHPDPLTVNVIGKQWM